MQGILVSAPSEGVSRFGLVEQGKTEAIEVG